MTDLRVTGGGSEVRILTLVDAITLSDIYGSPSRDRKQPTELTPQAASSVLYSTVGRVEEINGAANAEDSSLSVTAGAGDLLIWRMSTLSLNQNLVATIETFELSNPSPSFAGPFRKGGQPHGPCLLGLPIRKAVVSLTFRVEDDGDLFGFFLWKPQLELSPPGSIGARIVNRDRAGSAAA